MTPTVLVVGAASGIGEATARRMGARGWDVAAADRNYAEVQRVADSVGGSATAYHLDVTDRASVQAAVDQLAQRTETLDAVVVTAGVVNPAPSVEVTDEDWRRLLAVNLDGSFRVARDAYPLLARTQGKLVLVSSIAAHIGLPGRASYSAAKGGIEALTRSLAIEWAPAGIRVNAVAPGYVRTAIFNGAVEAGIIAEADIQSAVPVGRPAEPDEIAAVIAFLCSNDSSYITGQALVVDGGMTIASSW